MANVATTIFQFNNADIEIQIYKKPNCVSMHTKSEFVTKIFQFENDT